MRIFKFIKIISLTLTVFITMFLARPQKTYAAILFQDDFNDSNSVSSQWEVSRSGCETNWIVGNGMVGININSSACQTEFAPKDSAWGGWNNYIYEVDMILPPNSGTDKNTAFRYSGPPDFNWYGLHFQVSSNSSNVVLERVCFSPCGNSTTYTVTNGNTYRLKMIADNDHISAYIDNNLVLDIPNAERGFNTGKIALRAGVGADPHTEVYFDNVRVTTLDHVEPTPTPTPTLAPTPTPTPPSPISPVVVVPGMMGSWCLGAISLGINCPTNWTAWPEPIDPYDALVSSLIAAPDIPDSDVFVWYYDWRKRINELSGSLSSYITNTVLAGKPPGTKVNLVGHSYGGLVATRYTQLNSHQVDKLITVGSPHQGAVNAYGAWEGGELWGFSPLERIGIKLITAARGGLYRTEKDMINSEIPSIQEVLPTFDYLINPSGQIRPEDSYRQRNPVLPAQYSGLSAVAAQLTTITGLENDSDDTLLSIMTKTENWLEQALGLWEDGAVDQMNYSPEGDGTVLRQSGKFAGAGATPEVSANHLRLVTQASSIDQILQALGSAGAAIGSETTINDLVGNVIFFLRSPATFTVEVNGQTYSDADGLVFIPDISAATAHVTLTGTGNGRYHLDVFQIHPNGDSLNTYTGQIGTGDVHILDLSLNPALPPPGQLSDNTGEKNLEAANAQLDEVKEFIEASTYRNRQKSPALADVAAIKRLLALSQSRINDPSAGSRNIKSAISRLHKLRGRLNSNISHGLNETYVRLANRSISETIELLQSSFAIFSSRADRNFPVRRLTSLINTASRREARVGNKAETATSGQTAAAQAVLLSQPESQTAIDQINTDSALSYINAISARLYLNEAMVSLR